MKSKEKAAQGRGGTDGGQRSNRAKIGVFEGGEDLGSLECGKSQK